MNDATALLIFVLWCFAERHYATAIWGMIFLWVWLTATGAP